VPRPVAVSVYRNEAAILSWNKTAKLPSQNYILNLPTVKITNSNETVNEFVSIRKKCKKYCIGRYISRYVPVL
jgi:hypothetical protein